jgi:hypothetical protein
MQHNDPSVQENPSAWLPGFRLTHVFRLVSKVNLGLAAKVATHLEHAHARVDNWAMVRRGDMLDHKIVINDISEVRARALRDELHALEDGVSVRLEHLFFKDKSAAGVSRG